MRIKYRSLHYGKFRLILVSLCSTIYQLPKGVRRPLPFKLVYEVRGYDAKTGQLFWENGRTSVVNGNGTPLSISVRLVLAENAAAFPNVLFQWEGNCALRTTRVLTDVTTGGVSAQPVQPVAKPDPRLVRRARWKWIAYSSIFAWFSACSLVVHSLPRHTLDSCSYVMEYDSQRAVEFEKRFLLLPLLVAIIIVLLRIPVPEILERNRFNTSAFHRLGIAFSALPLIYFIGVLWDHLRQGHWRSLLVWAGVTLALGAIWLGVALNMDVRRFLSSEEYYVIHAWHIPLGVGIYCAGMAAAVWTMWETFFRWLKMWPKEVNQTLPVNESAIKSK